MTHNRSCDEHEKRCRYCGGNCPNDEDNACDGYLGDIDNLYYSLARWLINTNSPDEEDSDWDETQRAAYNGLSSTDYHFPE